MLVLLSVRIGPSGKGKVLEPISHALSDDVPDGPTFGTGHERRRATLFPVLRVWALLARPVDVGPVLGYKVAHVGRP